MIVYVKTQVDDLSEIIVKMVSYKNACRGQYPFNVNAFVSTNLSHSLPSLEFYTQVFVITF